MKLVEKSRQAGIEQEQLVKQHEQQLDQLREQATEQTKMQVTIAQQSKLIDYLQDKTPSSKSSSRIRKVQKCSYIDVDLHSYIHKYVHVKDNVVSNACSKHKS